MNPDLKSLEDFSYLGFNPNDHLHHFRHPETGEFVAVSNDGLYEESVVANDNEVSYV